MDGLYIVVVRYPVSKEYEEEILGEVGASYISGTCWRRGVRDMTWYCGTKSQAKRYCNRIKRLGLKGLSVEYSFSGEN